MFRPTSTNSPGTFRNDRAPLVTRIHPLFSASSTRFNCQRYLNNFKYFSIASESSTVSIGESTLYSRVNTSHPISPCEYSNMRASKRRRTSVGSCCALEERMADSSVAVRVCRLRALAGLAKLVLQAISAVDESRRKNIGYSKVSIN